MAASEVEDTSVVFHRFLIEAVSITERIQDTESADLYGAQLKTWGDFIMGLAMSAASKGDRMAFSDELKQRMQASFMRIKQANFYNSRIMMAAYDEHQLATLPPPTDEEKAKTKALILAAFADNHANSSTIKDKQSAEAYCINIASSTRLLRCAHAAKLVDAEHDSDIQQQIQLMMQDVKAISHQLKEHQYYNSVIIKGIFQ